MADEKPLAIIFPPDFPLTGVYANIISLNRNIIDFTIDFAHLTQGMPGALLRARVVLSPQNAKILKNLLSDAVESYEKEVGIINLPKDPKSNVIYESKGN